MIKALLVTVFGASLAACLLVPTVFDALAILYPTHGWPFSRIFDRVFLLFLIIFIVLFRRDFNLKVLQQALRASGHWRERVRYMLIGSLITSISVAVCVVSVFFGDYLSVNQRAPLDVLFKGGSTILGGFFIAFIEELVFRVLFFERLKDYFSLPFAVVLVSLLYAVVHFITPDKTFVYHGDSWWEGFLYVPALFRRLMLPGTGLGITGLFVVGVILAFAIQRFATVYLVIGLHAGWIFALKMISYLSWRNPDIPFPAGLTGRYAIFGEWPTWLSFILVLVLLVACQRFSILKRSNGG